MPNNKKQECNWDNAIESLAEVGYKNGYPDKETVRMAVDWLQFLRKYFPPPVLIIPETEDSNGLLIEWEIDTHDMNETKPSTIELIFNKDKPIELTQFIDGKVVNLLQIPSSLPENLFKCLI